MGVRKFFPHSTATSEYIPGLIRFTGVKCSARLNVYAACGATGESCSELHAWQDCSYLWSSLFSLHMKGALNFPTISSRGRTRVSSGTCFSPQL